MTVEPPVTTAPTAAPAPPVSRLKLFLTDSFYRNSLMLMVNTAAATLLGSVFWLIAVRRFAPAEVGLLSSTISASVLLGTASCLGLPNSIIRFLQQRTGTRALVLTATAVTAACSLVLSLVLLPSSWALPLARDHAAAGIALAVATVVLTAVGTTLDAVPVALRATHLLVAKNVPGGLVKVAALFLVPQVSVIDLAVANLAGMIASTLIAVVMLIPRLDGPARLRRRSLTGIWSFSLGNHAGMIFGILPSTVTPLIVLHRLGAEEAAFFGVIMQLTGLLNVVPATMSQSLFAELSARPDHRRAAILKAARALYAVMIPATLFTLAASHLLLRFFGRQYEAAGTVALRWMALGALVAGLNYLVDVAVNSLGRAWSFLLLNAVNAVLVLGFCGWAATHASGGGAGLVAVGQAWLTAQAASVAIGVVTYYLISRKKPENPSNHGRRGGRLRFLDGLRGGAAAFVVLSHAWSTVYPHAREHLAGPALATAWLGLGYYAVAIFIVVSGFSLGLPLWRHDGRWPGGPGDFLRRRFRRVVPTYWVALAVSAGIGATLLARPVGTLWDGAVPVRPGGVLSHALLVQDLWWAGPAGSTAFWSLAVEWHIYLFLFPLVLLLPQRGLPVLVAALTALSLATLLPGTSWAGNLHPTFSVLFLLGLISARAAVAETSSQRRAREQGLTLVTLTGAGAATVVTVAGQAGPLSPVHGLWFGPPVAAVLARMAEGSFALLRRALETPVLLFLGAISYSLYLTHAVVVEAVWRLAVVPLHLGETGRLGLELAGGLAAGVAVATVFFAAVERRFTAPAGGTT
ncbi:acyltransferase family protein [Kineosporia sp. J2-2]|uniref:Acyltransferase family protein n=1 Tax=Kineosporia corallincola TaxID=2835133 RepID=A0ABS5TLR2_9ACTN|nr:acyltransferase family protein [Kineosporia corallincola]MBT0772040.1 acyltransferase family protein [Kineosporia corallincola]